jgi:hypothetical protein
MPSVSELDVKHQRIKNVKIIMNRINLTEGELSVLAARIQRNYDYHDRSGLLVNRRSGKVVKGWKRDKRGYQSFGFRLGGRKRQLMMHRAVWAWHHGCFPVTAIDHINGDKTDNRIENLREVSNSENQLNTLHDWKPNRDSGLPGVTSCGNGYHTRIHGKVWYFGDACEAFFHATMCGKRYRKNERMKE